MPGRTRAEARNAFLSPLRRALSCVTTAQLLVSRSQRAGEELDALALSQDPLRLRSERLGEAIQFQLRHQFRLVKEREHLWHVSSAAYFYQLDDDSGNELIAWHWHPGVGVDHPHIHVSGGLIRKEAHLPTGRVSIESVLRLLLGEFQVKPTRDHAGDWADVLSAAEQPFLAHRRWHA